MKFRDEKNYLISLTKVFDVEFVSASEDDVLVWLDPNVDKDVEVAVHKVLLPVFSHYDPKNLTNLKELLAKVLTDPNENFDFIFCRQQFVFDTEVRDRRAFMTSLLRALEGVSAVG
jgi:hypothetical protein